MNLIEYDSFKVSSAMDSHVKWSTLALLENTTVDSRKSVFHSKREDMNVPAMEVSLLRRMLQTLALISTSVQWEHTIVKGFNFLKIAIRSFK